LTGTFTTTIDFGGGGFTTEGMRDAFVVQFDGETGNPVFARQLGGTGDDSGFGVDVDTDDNILVAGRFQNSLHLGVNVKLTSAGGRDIYLAKLDQLGEPLWGREFGGPGEDDVHDLKFQQNDDIVLIGGMTETMDFGGPPLISAGASDIFVATLDPNGEHVWSARYGDGVAQFDDSFETHTWLTLALASDGTIHAAGTLFGTLDFGETSLSAAGGTYADVFHFTLAADGSFLGGANYGGTSTDLALDIVLTNPAHAIIVGRSYGSGIDFGAAGELVHGGSGDGFVVKLAVP
jgi:hypothetical protein